MFYIFWVVVNETMLYNITVYELIRLPALYNVHRLYLKKKKIVLNINCCVILSNTALSAFLPPSLIK